jgi:hypothetical protein
MLPTPAYFAHICTRCQRASLLLDNKPESFHCAGCGAPTFRVPRAKFDGKDVPLFTELERIVHDAQLSKGEATLIAGELEKVGLRWEPPEMVLWRISSRLGGLQALYDPKQEYSRLLLVVGMLLTIVCGRLIGGTRPSGIRRVGVVVDAARQATVKPDI